MLNPTHARGDQTGIAFPVTIESLIENGAAFLTEAFHATGALDKRNRVREITGRREFFGGGMGRKLAFSVTYEGPAPFPATDLFAKFPRDFGDPLRDLFTPVMEPECRLALLSRAPGFPIPVPDCLFADYSTGSTSGILITERIRYGEAGIEPHHDKCLDYELDDALPHYQALAVASGRLAGVFKSGRLGPEAARLLPFEPDLVAAGSRIPHDAAQLQEKLAILQDFAREAPALFEPALRDLAFLEQFASEAPLVLSHEPEIRRILNGQADSISLCHWNANLDNAWFWRDGAGTLQAGLLDWGGAGQMNVAQGFYGMTCAAETGFLNQHRDALILLFAQAFTQAGGAAIDVNEMARQVRLATALLGIAWIIDAPSLVAAQIPEYRRLSGRRDPVLRNDFLARAQLQLLMVFLNDWRSGDIGGELRRLG